jgi:hypothetical protein
VRDQHQQDDIRNALQSIHGFIQIRFHATNYWMPPCFTFHTEVYTDEAVLRLIETTFGQYHIERGAYMLLRPLHRVEILV